jgi:Domain of unknown function (DUF4158)
MAVSFLTAAQRARYGRYPEVVTPDDLTRCFHLSDDDRVQIMSCRGHATCSPSASATTCRKLVTDVGAEGRKLQADVTFLRWYPVVSLGLGYRF